VQLLVLEHHPDGLTSEPGEGPLPERPLLAPWLRRAERDDAVLLEYADEIVAVEGDAGLLDVLDGTRMLEDLAPAERAAVAALAAERVVVPGPAVADEEALREAALGGLAPSVAASRLNDAVVVLAGAGAVAEEAARLLPGHVRRSGWDEAPRTINLAVAAPAPRELPELEAWNERCLEAGAPWLLVLPFNGRFASVGPLFVPGETCCYRCFTRRRASALPDPDDFLALELAPAAYPLGRSLAAALGGLAATVVARWLARRDGSVAGAFFALELDGGLRLTRHRVLRVPRCEACSPARAEPPLVPWASGVHR
jgi:bacteriocin biosynthesis cyclodehydratase domain-containing protein